MEAKAEAPTIKRRKIILIACSSRKLNRRAQAKDLYTGPLFKLCWAYALKERPDKIYILSALHGLLDPETDIDPYNVALKSPPKLDPSSPVKVLTAKEKKRWGNQVIAALSAVTDLRRDEFIVLAGKEYIKPLADNLSHLRDPLQGLNRGKRLAFLYQSTRAHF
jgi:cytoplasmic iron level regulating protein YaaA (DUF328/UPF0246 family)